MKALQRKFWLFHETLIERGDILEGNLYSTCIPGDIYHGGFSFP